MAISIPLASPAVRAFERAMSNQPAPADAEQPRAGGAQWVGPINGRKVRLALGTATISLIGPGETKYVHENQGAAGTRWYRAVLRGGQEREQGPSGAYHLANDLGVSNASNVFLAAVNAFLDATPQTIISGIQGLLDALNAPDGGVLQVNTPPCFIHGGTCDGDHTKPKATPAPAAPGAPGALCPGCEKPTCVVSHPACPAWPVEGEMDLVSRLAHKPGFQLRPPRVELLVAADDQSEPP